MPSGRTHDRITGWSLPWVIGITFSQTQSIYLTGALSVGFLLGGLLLGPDLDIRSVQYRRWGWLRWIWIPYRGSMRHRSPWSHSPVTGTALRIIYLAGWAILSSFAALALVNEMFNIGWTWQDIGYQIERSIEQHGSLWIALLIGLELGAMSHYVADWSVSTYRRCRHKGWKGLRESLPKSAKPRRSSRKSSRQCISKPSTSSSTLMTASAKQPRKPRTETQRKPRRKSVK